MYGLIIIIIFINIFPFSVFNTFIALISLFAFVCKKKKPQTKHEKVFPAVSFTYVSSLLYSAGSPLNAVKSL